METYIINCVSAKENIWEVIVTSIRTSIFCGTYAQCYAFKINKINNNR